MKNILGHISDVIVGTVFIILLSLVGRFLRDDLESFYDIRKD